MSKYRVMVVDDDPDIRFVVCGLLADDFETVKAENGLDALEKLERYEPDLMLLDIRMPVMDGFAACSSIRRTESYDSLPVFFLTGAGSEESRARATASGSSGYVEKPFETQALVSEIRGFFANHRQPPRLKTFTIRELDRIDKTPLRKSRPITVEAGAAERLHASRASGEVRVDFVVPPERLAPAAEKPAPPPPPAEPDPKARRVFGAGRKKDDLPEEDEGAEDRPTRPIRGITIPKAPEPAPTALPPKKPDDELIPISGSRQDLRLPTPPPTAPIEASIKPEDIPRFPPESPAPVRPNRPIPPGVKKPGTSLPTEARPRVLCLLDQREDAATFMAALKGIGEYLPLEDPVEAVEIIARFQPDIVVMRVHTKGYSGLQIAQLLQVNPRLAHTEVVFVLSGEESAAQSRAAQRLTKNTMLPLPLKGEHLRLAVKKIMEKPDFAIREKKLAYGVYVSEVVRKARAEEEAHRRLKEKAAFERKSSSLAAFMAKELKELAPHHEDEDGKPAHGRDYYHGGTGAPS